MEYIENRVVLEGSYIVEMKGEKSFVVEASLYYVPLRLAGIFFFFFWN